MLKKQFGKNLKYQREQRKLTQEMASELCDLSPRYWGKLERGEVAASIDTIEKAMEQTISYKNTKVENVPEWYADTKQTEPDEELKARIARLQEKLGETNHGEN